MHLMDDNFPYVYMTSRFSTLPNMHYVFTTQCNGNGKMEETVNILSWKHDINLKIIHLAAPDDYEQVSSCCAGFQHWCRPSYQHLLNTKVFAVVVYMDLTFTSRSAVTFPPTTAEIELLAVLPTWQGSVASPGSLALQLSPTGWESGGVDGSAAWLLAASLPSWPGERAGMGSPVSQCIDRGPALH